MGDNKLDTTQIINGIAVLLSFFVGYKYALKKNGISSETDEAVADASSSSNKGTGDGARVQDEINYSRRGNYKMVLLVRNDLRMGKGKIAAQCGHGAVGAYQTAVQRTPRLLRAWENTGCAKVALRVDSEKEMMALKRAAEANNLNTCLIRDAGRTQIEPNSKTVLAIGPANVEDIDRVTGHLKLL